jgi:mRNA interferase HigB
MKSWHKEMVGASWSSPVHIKNKYPSASILDNQRVVFNIKGNHYRIVIRINYQFKIIWIRFVGTHSEYDQIDAKTI